MGVIKITEMQIALFSLGYFKARVELPMICRNIAERARGVRKNAATFLGGQKDAVQAKPSPGTAIRSLIFVFSL